MIVGEPDKPFAAEKYGAAVKSGHSTSVTETSSKLSFSPIDKTERENGQKF